jgi:hypothetical protein
MFANLYNQTADHRKGLRFLLKKRNRQVDTAAVGTHSQEVSVSDQFFLQFYNSSIAYRARSGETNIRIYLKIMNVFPNPLPTKEGHSESVYVFSLYYSFMRLYL